MRKNYAFRITTSSEPRTWLNKTPISSGKRLIIVTQLLRPILFLLAVVVLPLVLLGWLGRMMWRDQKTAWEAQWRSSLQHDLQVSDQQLAGEMERMSTQLDALLTNTQSTDAALIEIVSMHPLVRHAFRLDAKGMMAFPSVGHQDQLSLMDMEFLQRTAPVWNTGLPLGRGIVAEDVILKSKPLPANGWHTWFYADGPQWLYWKRLADGTTLGVELERAAFFAALIARTDNSKACAHGSRLRLTAADGTVLHQWGAFEPPALRRPVMTLVASAPLQHWRWELFLADTGHGRPPKLPFILAGTGVATLIGSIGLLIFMTWRRDLRVAAQRVSFVNQVSHELKTPLTNIRLYTDLARDAAERGEPQAAQHLSVVQEETGRLSRLIHNVLTFARQERHGLQVHLVRGDLCALVRRVASHWRALLERKQIVLQTSGEENCDAFFDADAMEQVLGNLLSNIEKYAVGARHAELSVGTRDGFVEVRVHDDGAGIPRSVARRVFEPFYRVRSDVTEGAAGTGLGLSIARALAEAQGGTLKLEPVERGTLFVLRIPAKNHQPV